MFQSFVKVYEIFKATNEAKFCMHVSTHQLCRDPWVYFQLGRRDVRVNFCVTYISVGDGSR